MALAVLYLVFGFVVAMSWQFHALEACSRNNSSS